MLTPSAQPFLSSNNHLAHNWLHLKSERNSVMMLLDKAGTKGGYVWIYSTDKHACGKDKASKQLGQLFLSKTKTLHAVICSAEKDLDSNAIIAIDDH